MKNFLLFTLAAVSIVFITAQQTAPLSEKEIEDIAVDTYLYAYPTVTMELTRTVMTNVAVPEDNKAPMGQFFHARSYPDATFKDVTAPNADTLYSTAWLNLSKEPYVLHVPEEKDRYYLMPMLSAWTNVFASPGSRTTGNSAQDFLITGPDWKGNIPDGLTEFKSPTNLIWILGRTYSSGTSDDYRAVHALQKEYTLIPLSFYGKPYTPAKGVVDHNVDMKTPIRNQVNDLNILKFFSILANSMKINPPAPEDAPILEKMAKIGIVPGKDFDFKNIDPNIAKILEKAPKLAQEKIKEHEKIALKRVNGWTYMLDTGTYATNYLERAFVAEVGLGANLPQDAIYPYAKHDEEGKVFDGKNKYVIHFAKGGLPPVKGFWSLTLYNTLFYFSENVLDRYTLSQRDSLRYNEDGSLDLYIQNASPGKEKESNWLPAPADGFILMLRFYWPEEKLLDGEWKPPVVKKIAEN